MTVLSVLLKKAVEWDVIDKVPCTIRLVRAPKPSMGFYDFDEYERLLEAAKELGVGKQVIYQLIENGEIRAVKKEGGGVLVEKRSLDEFRASGRLP